MAGAGSSEETEMSAPPVRSIVWAAAGFRARLSAQGIPEYEAKRYECRLMKGIILISVQCDKPEEIEHATGQLHPPGLNASDRFPKPISLEDSGHSARNTPK